MSCIVTWSVSDVLAPSCTHLYRIQSSDVATANPESSKHRPMSSLSCRDRNDEAFPLDMNHAVYGNPPRDMPMDKLCIPSTGEVCVPLCGLAIEAVEALTYSSISLPLSLARNNMTSTTCTSSELLGTIHFSRTNHARYKVSNYVCKLLESHCAESGHHKTTYRNSIVHACT